MSDLTIEEVEDHISQSISMIEDVINTNKHRFIAEKDKLKLLESNIDFMGQWKVRFADLSLDWTAANSAKKNALAHIKKEDWPTSP